MKDNAYRYKAKFKQLEYMKQSYKTCPTRAAADDIKYMISKLDELFEKLSYREKEEIATWSASQNVDWLDED